MTRELRANPINNEVSTNQNFRLKRRRLPEKNCTAVQYAICDHGHVQVLFLSGVILCTYFAPVYCHTSTSRNPISQSCFATKVKQAHTIDYIICSSESEEEKSMMHSKSSLSRSWSSSRSLILFVVVAIITTGTVISGRYFLYATTSSITVLSHVPQYTFASIVTLISTISESDNIGNLLAALVAVAGYLLDAYNTRKYKQLETQIERVSCQSRNLLVPITTQFHSLYTISTLQFVDNYLTKDMIHTYINDHPNYTTSILSNLQTTIDSNKGNGTASSVTTRLKKSNDEHDHNKKDDDVDQFCSQFVELYIHATASGYYEIPENLQNPVSLAFLNEDVLFRRKYEEIPQQDDDDENVDGADDEDDVVQPPTSVEKVSETTTTRTSASSMNSNSTSSSSIRPTLIKSTNDVKKYSTTIQGKKSNSRRPGAITSPQELPNPLHYALQKLSEEEKPTSYLWKSYELFIRNEFVPTVNTIASIIEEHGNIMEPVPPPRLQEIYGQTSNGYGQTWNISPRMWFYSMWLSYSKSWDSILHLWDNGIYTRIRPTVPFPCGILFFNIEAQSIVANAEKKLIGISQMHGYSS